MDLDFLRSKLNSNSKKCPKTDCILWTAGKTSGYGNIRTSQNEYITSHRASWLVNKGKIPNGLYVLHKCDVRACINPDHLFVGTHLDNIKDMVSKNRHAGGFRLNPPIGEKHWGSILTAKNVEEIRIKYKTKKFTMQSIGDEYGVTKSSIFRIVRNKSWKHTKERS